MARNQQVGAILSNDLSTKVDSYADLLLYVDSIVTQRLSKSIFVNLFEKPVS